MRARSARRGETESPLSPACSRRAVVRARTHMLHAARGRLCTLYFLQKEHARTHACVQSLSATRGRNTVQLYLSHKIKTMCLRLDTRVPGRSRCRCARAPPGPCRRGARIALGRPRPVSARTCRKRRRRQQARQSPLSQLAAGGGAPRSSAAPPCSSKRARAPCVPPAHASAW